METLRTILQDKEFNIDKDIVLIKTRKRNDKVQYSTAYTLLDLDYNVEDVVERLKELKLEEYSESLIDRDDANPPTLFVFEKVIHGKQVYIKLKIKEKERQYILCVSFHYAEYVMSFPYA